MVSYIQGTRERIVNDLTNLYVFTGITLKDYDNSTPEKQESIMNDFNDIHIRICKKTGRKIMDDKDAKDTLWHYFNNMDERQLRAIYHIKFGPKSKSSKIKEKASMNSGRPKEPYCKAEQLDLFPK
jgi:hypothetical protein